MSTARYQKQREDSPLIIDAQAAIKAYAFENIGSIVLGEKARPIPSSKEGRTFTTFFSTDDYNNHYSCTFEEIMEMFQREDIEVIFAGYWYDGKLIAKYDEDGHVRKQWISFDKSIKRTEAYLEKIFSKADEVVKAAEPQIVEVPVPMVDWQDRFKLFAFTVPAVYLLAIISLLIVR